jgi:RNase P/RNase MRP subunit POP5
MDRESLEMQVEMCMLSLYGKVGAAQLQFALRDYSRKASTFTLMTDLE